MKEMLLFSGATCCGNVISEVVKLVTNVISTRKWSRNGWHLILNIRLFTQEVITAFL
jgi:hypothetical protein